MKLIEIGEGTATAEIEVKDHMLNSHGQGSWSYHFFFGRLCICGGL